MFFSILFPRSEQHQEARNSREPECFRDLGLDYIVTSIVEARKEFELAGLYYTPLTDASTIIYRQDILRDLESESILGVFSEFAKTIYWLNKKMLDIRKDSAVGGLDYLSMGRMLDYAEQYSSAIVGLIEKAATTNIQSSGLSGFVKYLAEYSHTGEFSGLLNTIRRLRKDFNEMEYCLLIKDGTLKVRKYESQADHSAQILACFEKFRQGNTKNDRKRTHTESFAPHVEAAILRLLSKVYKVEFNALAAFSMRYINFVDDIILRFSKDLQFYLSWLDYIRPIKRKGLQFSYPEMCETAECLHNYTGFDAALAYMSMNRIVTNDFTLNSPEQMLVITGPNQGGKTTYARAFGQIHYLASLGLCVPGNDARLFMFDNILTHFAREEDLSTLNGKLKDDIIRLHALLDKATKHSIIIVNEIFSSTTLDDAIELGGHMMDALCRLGAPAIIVTFLDELALHGQETVSMMSVVSAENPAERTFKIVRKPPDGLAYALQIASKHGLTYEQLSRRLEA